MPTAGVDVLTSVLMRQRLRHAAINRMIDGKLGTKRSVYHVNADNLPGNEVSRTFEGAQHGQATVSFFLVNNSPGQGPELHHHPYDETFIILEGQVLVQVGEETVVGGPGDIVVGPPGIPHGFTNVGPGLARLVCIHAAPAMRTTFT
jgi:quercetin dioxygenase-like cupin family protein